MKIFRHLFAILPVFFGLIRFPLIPFLILILLTGCKKYSWNQRVTLVVQTPSGPAIASTVSKVIWKNVWDSDKVKLHWIGDVVHGEMPFVVLPDGRHVFALMLSPSFLISLKPYRYNLKPNGIYPKIKKEDIKQEDIKQVAQASSKTRKVCTQDQDFPFLVTFGDLSNPRTISRFLSDSICLIVEKTTEPVTPIGSIDKLLPWLREFSPMASFLEISPTAFKVDPHERNPIPRTMNQYFDQHDSNSLPIVYIAVRDDFLREAPKSIWRRLLY